MKDPQKNEIEMLLRNLGKAQTAGATANDDHLDADELNSFAEGQLPPATRSRYVTHLAECDRCRKIVAQLAPAAGLQHVRAEVKKERSAWKNIATVFSPMMMRYAIPALALVILGIAWGLWIKREPDKQFVAQQAQPTPLSGLTSNTPEPASPGQTASPSEQNGRLGDAKPTAAKATERESKTAGSASESANQPAAKTGDKTVAAAAATPAAAKEAEAYAQTPAPASAKTEQEAPKDTPSGAGDSVAKSKPVETGANKADVASSNSVARNAGEESGRETSKTARKKAAPRSAIAGSVVGGLLAERDEKLVTRSVAGRQFRRVDNIWIDTAYDASVATTTIRRGSEQYRALVGDEPGLRTIAEQLDGEVVVVWKGKAYRIR